MKKQQGFTLIELMIVVAVIGVLSAIAVPKYQEYAKKGALGSALATATALKTPIETYIADNGQFPTNAQLSGAMPTFSLGAILLTPTASSEDGDLKITLNKSSANGAEIKLTKLNGLWTCGISNASGTTITGCN